MGKIVSFGELMLRLSTTQNRRFTQTNELQVTFAGAEANVAVACAQFGHEAVFVSALPRHGLAEAALQQLASWNVDTSAVIRGEGRMGVYYLEEGFGVRPSSVIYDRAGSAFVGTDLEVYDWDAVLKNADWLHLSGITPALSSHFSEKLSALAERARRRGVLVSLDLNYRSKLWSLEKARSVLPALAWSCDLLLASVHQVGDVLEVSVGDKGMEASLKAARSLCQKFEIDGVVLTSRETTGFSREKRWAVGVMDRIEARSQILEYEILDPLGGGDAFSGGFLSALMKGLPLDRALDMAVAASAWKYSHHGDYLQGSWEEVSGLLEKTPGRQVNR